LLFYAGIFRKVRSNPAANKQLAANDNLTPTMPKRKPKKKPQRHKLSVKSVIIADEAVDVTEQLLINSRAIWVPVTPARRHVFNCCTQSCKISNSEALRMIMRSRNYRNINYIDYITVILILRTAGHHCCMRRKYNIGAATMNIGGQDELIAGKIWPRPNLGLPVNKTLGLTTERVAIIATIGHRNTNTRYWI
jgi:hypothetical protein